MMDTCNQMSLSYFLYLYIIGAIGFCILLEIDWHHVGNRYIRFAVAASWPMWGAALTAAAVVMLAREGVMKLWRMRP